MTTDTVDAIDGNIRYIAEQAVAEGLVQYPSLQINGGIRGGDEFDVSDATYDPSTGLTTLTIGTHSLIAGNRVTVKLDRSRFTCTSDGNQTVLPHPRKSDTPYNRSQLLTDSNFNHHHI